MSKVKLVITTFVAVLALSALASTASAATAGWMVNGSLLSGSKALATTAKVDKNGKLKSVSANIEFECSGSTLNGLNPELIAPSTGKASDLEFTSCKALTPNCTIEPTNIKTVAITAEATLEGALAVVATFKPQTKTVFSTFKFIGASCASAGENAVTGTAKILAPTGQDESALQDINAIATETSGELKVASSAAELTGSALLQLATGEKWSYL